MPSAVLERARAGFITELVVAMRADERGNATRFRGRIPFSHRVGRFRPRGISLSHFDLYSRELQALFLQ